MDLYNGFSLPSQSTSSVQIQLPQSVLALSENQLPLKEFIFTFVHAELLKNRNIRTIEQNIEFKSQRVNKLVEEIEAIESMTDEDLEKHKNLLDNSREKAWQSRREELLEKKKNLEKSLEKALQLRAPTEDFKPFLLHVQNKIRFAIFIVDEHIIADPKPEIESDLQKWKKDRLGDLKWSLEENDRIITNETRSLKEVKEWMGCLSKSLNEQLPSLPVVKNEPEG